MVLLFVDLEPSGRRGGDGHGRGDDGQTKPYLKYLEHLEHVEYLEYLEPVILGMTGIPGPRALSQFLR